MTGISVPSQFDTNIRCYFAVLSKSFPPAGLGMQMKGEAVIRGFNMRSQYDVEETPSLNLFETFLDSYFNKTPLFTMLYARCSFSSFLLQITLLCKTPSAFPKRCCYSNFWALTAFVVSTYLSLLTLGHFSGLVYFLNASVLN